MAIFGTIGLFAGPITIASGELSFWRSIIALCVLTISFAFSGGFKALKVTKKQLFLLVLSGSAMAANWIFLFNAYKLTGVALSTLCYYFAPALVIIGSWLLYKEKLTWMQGICFLVATTGVVLIAVNGGTGEGNAAGIALGLAAALCYAFVVLVNKSINDMDSRARTFYQFLVAAVFLLPYVYMDSGFAIGSMDFTGIACLLTLGIIHTGIAYLMYFSALSGLTGQQAATLSYIDPFTAVLLSVVILQEPLGILQIIGGVAVLAGTLCSELLPTKKK